MCKISQYHTIRNAGLSSVWKTEKLNLKRDMPYDHRLYSHFLSQLMIRFYLCKLLSYLLCPWHQALIVKKGNYPGTSNHQADCINKLTIRYSFSGANGLVLGPIWKIYGNWNHGIFRNAVNLSQYQEVTLFNLYLMLGTILRKHLKANDLISLQTLTFTDCVK